ncbi:MAG: hypothetical protein DRI56_05750 [Chloroflexota bacterium]|nr:MAG: hypothetical protein DRI56_05750 [Chloroflexota bacterium]
METTFTFHPPRRSGTIFHHLSITLLTFAGAWGIWQISKAQIGPQLILYIFTILIVLVAVPLFIYRYYALRNSSYTLKREGIYLQWGWRNITIPINQIKWVHFAYDLDTQLQPPQIRWPGSVLGKRSFYNGPPVEFMAANTKNLIVIAVPDHYYAISPTDANQFLETYHHLIELGSLQNIPQQSTRSTILLTLIWQQKPAFYTILTGLILNLTLLIWTLFIIPNRPQISLGFTSQQLPHEPLASVRLILLPIINTFSFLTNLITGLFFFRSKQTKLLAYLLWGSSILIALVFHIGIYFITK